MDKEEKIIKQTEMKSEPEVVEEHKTVQVPKTVMEERMVTERKTVMRQRPYEKWIAATCDKISDMKVIDANGEDLGSISDIMIDLDSGRVLYAVMSFGGFFSKKSFAIPWEAFSVNNREHYYEEGRENNLILNIPKDKFDESEGFDQDNWPREPDQRWLSDTYSRYGYKGWWTEETNR